MSFLGEEKSSEVCVFFFFFCQRDAETEFIWKKEISIEELLSSDWPVKESLEVYS